MPNGLHVVMLAAEAAPLAKAGGLADVVGALSPELEALGFQVSIVLPFHRAIKSGHHHLESVDEAAGVSLDVKRLQLSKGTAVYLIANDHYFDRPGIYTDPATGKDYFDQAERWIYFQRSALEFVRMCLPQVDIIHCHDNQTGLVPAYLDRQYRGDPRLRKTGTVFTIHNLGYQGDYSGSMMSAAGFDPREFSPLGPFEFYGRMNFMKIALVFADAVTTVSQNYAREIQEPGDIGFGMQGVLAARSDPLIGILNGIDVAAWNPETDSSIPATYSRDDLSGKAANKQALLREFGLDSADNAPLLGMVSRIETQKGFDLVIAILDSLLDRNTRFVLLGQGNKELEWLLAEIAGRHPGRAGIRYGYDNDLAHRIEAGADIFLMPSRYEPCGLNQMYSMRYGTIPVVRATGGLADTVQEFTPTTGDGTGFSFYPYDADAFSEAVDRALQCWHDREAWQRVVQNAMSVDFSWARSAEKYAQVYELVKKRRS